MSQDQGFDLYQKGLSLREPRWKEALIGVGALVFSVGGAWMLVDAPGIKEKLIGGGVLLWFGLSVAQRVRSLLTKTPVVRLSPLGLSDGRWGDLVIPWTAVSEAWVKARWGERIVCFDLHWTELARHDLGGIVESLARYPKEKGYGDLQIFVSGLDHRPEKVVAYANAYIAQAAAAALESTPAR